MFSGNDVALRDHTVCLFTPRLSLILTASTVYPRRVARLSCPGGLFYIGLEMVYSAAPQAIMHPKVPEPYVDRATCKLRPYLLSEKLHYC